MRIIGSDNPSKFVDGVKQNDDFSLNVTQLSSGESGIITDYTYADSIVSISTAISPSNFNIQVIKTLNNNRDFTYINNTPSVCDVSKNGDVIAKPNTSGVADIDVEMLGVGTRNHRQTIAFQGVLKNTGVQYSTGSLAKHINDNVLNLISGKNFNDLSRPADAYKNGTRNPDAFCASLDFSGVQWMAGQGKITLISKRHGITCNHSHGAIEPGVQVTFRDATGTQSQTVTVVRSQSVQGSKDLYIGYFDQDITVATPYKVLPTNIQNRLPSNSNNGVVIPSIMFQTRYFPEDGISNYSINGVYNLDEAQPEAGVIEHGTLVYNKTNNTYSGTDPLYQWSSPLVGGDSGSPMFLPIKENNTGETKLVLIGVTYYGNFYGDNLSLIVPKLNNIMNSMKNPGDTFSYSMGVIGLSNFNTY